MKRKTMLTVMVTGLLLGATGLRADGLRIENVTAAPRDGKTALVTFDLAWSNAWRHGSFHDAAWVFFKVRADDKTGWQPVRLVADKVVNPTGYGQEQGGTRLEFVVPGGEDGFVGMFVRPAAEGKGVVAATKVTAVWDLAANKGVPKDLRGASVRGFGIEMVYVAEGPFCLGSGGKELNRFHAYTGDGQETPPYRVTGAGPIATGRQEGKLWAAGIAPEDGSQIQPSFPNGYAALYCMKYFITQGQYADFLNTLTEAQAKERFHMDGHGRWINRAGESPNHTYSASGRPPNNYFSPRASERDQRCPWLSWADGAVFAAWAGLRPMTELEYEKACRGPLSPTPNEQGLSYWGVVEMNAALVYERLVSAGNAAGRAFAGTHGRGTLSLPADWPSVFGSVLYRGDYVHGRQYSSVGHLRVSGRLNAVDVHADRKTHPLAGWRGARSAPKGDALAGLVAVRFDPRIARPIARLGRPLRADGVLDEWGKPAFTLGGIADLFPLYRRFPSPASPDTWHGPADLEAKVYLGWDAETLCVAVMASDDQHFNTKTGQDLWNGDALQMGLVTARGFHWNLGLALTQEGVAFHQFAGAGDTLLKTADCAVVRDDKAKVTHYELRLPLAVLGLEPGAELGVNLLLLDDDGKGQRHWLALAPGLAPGSSAGSKTALYPRFVLEK